MSRQVAIDDAKAAPRKTVIFLGAGASAADDAPLQSDLLRGFFAWARPMNLPGDKWHLRANLAWYFWNVWGVNVRDRHVSTAQFPTFEEALGLLELAEIRGERFSGSGRISNMTWRHRKIKDDLVGLIAIYLEQKLRHSGTYHGPLVSNLFSHRPRTRTAFISLNYDILIDNALLVTPGVHADYGVDFTNRTDEFAPTGIAVPMLKLHGSLNWLFCPTCNALDHYPGRKIAAELYDSPHRALCGRCQEPRVPIIIPPTFYKVMSNYYLQQIWKRAEEELKQARRIIFCGYSFPDADMHIRYLLKRAELNRTGLPPFVFIVNEHDRKTDHERNLERDRYLRFFRQKDQVHWTKLSFQDFAANPQLIEDKAQWL